MFAFRLKCSDPLRGLRVFSLCMFIFFGLVPDWHAPMDRAAARLTVSHFLHRLGGVLWRLCARAARSGRLNAPLVAPRFYSCTVAVQFAPPCARQRLCVIWRSFSVAVWFTPHTIRAPRLSSHWLLPVTANVLFGLPSNTSCVRLFIIAPSW